MRLYNILIVDDEAFVVDWLSELLENQKEFNFNIYTAYNSMKAIEWMERTRIDLLISDIRMPNTNGLELVERINNLWPFCKCILLTAHADFDYAHTAIQKGVISYILKTEDDNHILSEVKKALHIIDKELNQQQLFNDTQKNLSNSLSQLKHQVFFQWLRGNYLNSNELNNCIEILGFESNASPFCLMIGTLDHQSATSLTTTQMKETLKFFQAKTIIEHYIEPYTKYFVSNINNNKMIWIIQPNEVSINRFSSLISGSLEIAQQSCLETTGIMASFVISVPTKSANELPEAYFTGKSLLSSHNHDSFILTYHIGDKTNVFEKENDTLSILSQTLDLPKHNSYTTLKKHLENGNRLEFISLLRSICNKIKPHVNWHNNRTLEAYYSTVLVLISYINQQNLAHKLAFQTSLGILFRPWLAPSWLEIENQLFQISDLLFQLQEETKKRTSHDTIQVVVDYIHEHIMEDISLIDLSDLTGYSSSYLSKFFSDNYGATLSDYIAKCKIEKIKDLMLDSNLNIGDIATAVGFHSRTYFNNFFKRHVGIAPQQYRDQME